MYVCVGVYGVAHLLRSKLTCFARLPWSFNRYVFDRRIVYEKNRTNRMPTAHGTR